MARSEQMAMNEARAMINADAREGRIVLTQRIDVETEGGDLIHRLRCLDAVKIELPADSPPTD